MSTFFQRTGVAVDAIVTPQATPDMTVAVAAGTAYTANASADVSAGNLTIAPAHAALERIDAIVFDAATGTKSVIQGTETDPLALQAPDTTGYTVLGYVTVVSRQNPEFTGTITADAIRTPVIPDYVQTTPGANTLAYTYDTATGAADPGTGKLRFNSVTLSSITTLRINYGVIWARSWLIPGTQPMTALMRPYLLRLWSLQNPGNYMTLLVTGTTNNVTYATLTCQVAEATTATTNVSLTTDPGDTIVEYIGPVGGYTQYNGTSTLGADVTMTNANQFYDGPNTGSIGASGQELLVMAYATVVGGGTGQVTMRITDGTTVFGEANAGGATAAAGNYVCHALIAPSAAATYKITCASNVAGGAIKADPTANSSGAHVGTRITWIRVV